MAIARVWIEPGCIRCSACVYSSPQVFALSANADAVIQGCARSDGIDSANRDERSPLESSCASEHDERIREAMEGCPVGIIQIDEGAR